MYQNLWTIKARVISEYGGQRNVPGLVTEQVEADDLLLIDNIDLAKPKQVGTLDLC